MDFAGTYIDDHGSETITISNDGETLRTTIRGVEFVSYDLDGFSPVDSTPTECLHSFTLNQGALCACVFNLEISVTIATTESELQGTLYATLELGSPTENGGISHERLRLELAYANERVASSSVSGWFEDGLLDLQARLPEGVFIKACINCLYSDYSPSGHGVFGCMMCFRNIKDEYLRVHSKNDFWAVNGRQERMVQETYLCPDFARRLAGTGYRG
jgi:uncharacterized protein DUF6304